MKNAETFSAKADPLQADSLWIFGFIDYRYKNCGQLIGLVQ